MPSRAVRFSPAALLFLSALGACGGDDGGSTELEGIYELASWTHNPDGCDSEGPPSFEESTYTHFFVRHDSFFGEEFVSAIPCEDLDTCRTKASDQDTLYLGNFTFDSGSDDEGWTGSSFFLSVGDASCSGSVFEAHMTGDPGAAVQIDQETKLVSDVPLDDMGDCQDQAAYDQAASMPCAELTVVMGTFVEGI